MDLELMINSLPKLLNAAVITLKLLSVSLIIGLFIGLFFAKNKPMNNPIIKETERSFKVITAAFSNFGRLLIINSRSISTPYYI